MLIDDIPVVRIPLAYDIADTVKTYTSIPVAMSYAATHNVVDVNELLVIFAKKLNEVNITAQMTDTIINLFQKRL